jgi:hypothetical protein
VLSKIPGTQLTQRGPSTRHPKLLDDFFTKIFPPSLLLIHSAAAGAPRVNLLYLTDCLLSHARRPSAPPAARILPVMVGAGLTRMLQLAVTDGDSLQRVRRAVDAWGRKGLLEAAYLRLGYERLDAAATAIHAAAATSAAAAAAEQQAVAVPQPAVARSAEGRSAGRTDKRQVRAVQLNFQTSCCGMHASALGSHALDALVRHRLRAQPTTILISADTTPPRHFNDMMPPAAASRSRGPPGARGPRCPTPCHHGD